MGEIEATPAVGERCLEQRMFATGAAATTARAAVALERLADSAQASHSHTIEEVTR
jgi:hypothetical protein